MGLSVRLLKLWGFSRVDSLLADKVQMRFPHVHPFIFPPGFSSISEGLSSRSRSEHFLPEEGRKQLLDCRQLGPVVIQIGPNLGVQRMAGRKKRDMHPPLKHTASRAAVPFPAALGVRIVMFWWRQRLGSAGGEPQRGFAPWLVRSPGRCFLGVRVKAEAWLCLRL